MLKKLNSTNLFSMESHEDETVKELDEQGVVEIADTEEVVAEATPSPDVEEAGDNIAQQTPGTKDITADDKADITEGSVKDMSSGDVVAEVTTLTEQGVQAAQVKDEIVATAIAEVGGSEAADTDVNGNAITPEQAEENVEESEIDEEVDEEAEEEIADKDIHTQASDVTENAEEELSDAIGTDSGTDGGVDGEATDDTSDNIDTGGDEGDLGMDADLGGEGDPVGGDDLATDDTPSEEEPSVTDDTGASDGDVANDETTEGSDTDTVDSNDGGDLDLDDDTPLEGAEPVDTTVTEDVEQQNEAADVTAEAASADVDQTEFIADEEPAQHGELPADDVVPNDGEEIVAEAKPAIQNTEDVSTANANNDIANDPINEVDLDEEDDTPLEGTEPLDVDATQDLTPKEVDGEGPVGGATVEESESDQQAEAIDDPVVDEVVEETEEEPTNTDVEDEVVEEAVTEPLVPEETEVVVDTDAGEIEVTEDEADLEEGELDIPDVDTDTTEEEVEEAEEEAAEVEAEADAEEELADDADKTIEELQKEQEALEEFKTILEYGIATESYSPHMLGYIAAKTENIRKILVSVDQAPKAVSLESYGSQDIDLAYVASLESIRGMIDSVSKLSSQVANKVAGWWTKSLVDKVKVRTDALNKKIDLCLVELKDSDVGTKDVKAIGAYLSHSEGNLVKACADDLKLITEVGGRGLKATEDLQANLIKALNEVGSAKTPEAAHNAVKRVAGFEDIKQSFPNDAFSKGFVGGHKLKLKDAVKGDDLADRILDLGRRAVPVVIKEGKGTNGTQKLSKGDVSNLLKLAKAYVALANKLADTTGDRAQSNIAKIKLTNQNAKVDAIASSVFKDGNYSEIRATAHALEIVSKAHNDLYKFITKHCIDTADAICGVAKKVTK